MDRRSTPVHSPFVALLLTAMVVIMVVTSNRNRAEAGRQPSDGLVDRPTDAVAADDSLNGSVESPDATSGLTVEYVYRGEVFTNMHGGISTRDATKYRGDLGVEITTDLDELGLLPGGRFFIYGENGHGRGITERYVGDFQVLSNIDAPDFVQVSEYWWNTSLWNGSVEVWLGKQDSNRVFAVVDLAGDFVNSSFGFHPTIPMPTFPNPSMAAAAAFHIADWISFDVGIWDGVPEIGTWGFSGTGVTFSICEVNLHYKLGHGRHLPGSIHFGPWYHSDQWENLAPGSTDTFSGNYGFHLEAQQTLVAESSHDPDDDQGLGAFVQYGWSPADRNKAHQYVGGGLVYKGPVACRDEDLLGAGVAHLIFSDRLPDREPETAVELFYRAQLRPWLFVQPDVQFIAQPGGNRRDALVFGIRFEMAQ